VAFTVAFIWTGLAVWFMFDDPDGWVIRNALLLTWLAVTFSYLIHQIMTIGEGDEDA
jgi:hypothetical protein